MRLVCPFCDKSFTRRSWFDAHGEICPTRSKFENRFGKQKFLPKVAQLRTFMFAHGEFFVTFLTNKMERAVAEQEFHAEVAAMKAKGRRPAGVVTSSEVIAEMIESGYAREELNTSTPEE